MQEAEHPNVATVRELFAAFRSADVERIVAAVPADLVWHFPGRRGALAGSHRGRDAVLGFLAHVMELTDTPEVAAFRAECRAWLEANADPRPPGSSGSVTGVLGTDIDSEESLARARDYQRRAAADGWAAVGWPREYGGRGASFIEQIVFGEEASRFDVPDHVFRIGVTMGGPTVIAHGTDEQRARWLPPSRSPGVSGIHLRWG